MQSYNISIDIHKILLVIVIGIVFIITISKLERIITIIAKQAVKPSMIKQLNDSLQKIKKAERICVANTLLKRLKEKRSIKRILRY